MKLNTYYYRKDQSYTTDRQEMSATGRGLSPRQEPGIQYALSRNITESQWSDIQRGWTADRNDPHIRQFMGEALRGGRRQGVGETPGRGRKPIMDCSNEETVRKAIENDRQSVMKANET